MLVFSSRLFNAYFMRISSVWLLCMGMLLTHTATAQLTPQLPHKMLSPTDNSTMLLIPAGTFEFGMDRTTLKRLVKHLKRPWLENIQGQTFTKQQKWLPDYYIDQYPVTNARYQEFIKATGHQESHYSKWPQFNDPQQPVVGIGWADAKSYCSWAGKRLPTEEEWEKAARGTDGRIWPWGNVPNDQAYNGRAQRHYAPVKVGSFPKSNSPYGVSDMAGNVWEMTTGNFPTAGNPSNKAMRGGCFLNTDTEVSTITRWAAKDPEHGAEWLGFRCVMDVKK